MSLKKLIINSKTIEGVPINEYFLDNNETKGLIFIQHGYTSNKDYGADYLALHLARSGYFVVSVDAYKHGERIAEPFISFNENEMMLEVPTVIRHTAVDIIKLHKRYYIDKYPKYDFIGISMGAMIAYYLATKTDKIRKLVPVIGTPDFVDKAYHGVQAAGMDIKKVLNPDTIYYLTRISPLTNVHKMKYDELFILCCTHDDMVPMEATQRFYEEHQNDKTTMKIYIDGHNVNRDMQQDIFAYIKK